MAVTLDPDVALVVVDLQNGIVGSPPAVPIGPIVARCVSLVRAFRAHAEPVVLVNVTGSAPGRTAQPRRSVERPAGWADLIPELARSPSDLTVTKRTWGAFTDTGLDAMLRRANVTQVVVAGVATSLGVESTARQAYELGYDVTLAVDAMTDVDPGAHENSMTRIFPRLGETATASEIVALLGAPAA